MIKAVSFPMYDLPGLEPVWDAWWAGLRRHMAAAGIDDLPEGRTRLPHLSDHWREPGTILTQTCGYPYLRGLSEHWRLVATLCFDVPWCEGARYRNLVLVGSRLQGAAGLEDLRGLRVAYNGSESHSGYNSLRAMVAPLARNGRFFSGAVETGSHLQTIEAIGSGAADCGSVDCVTFALARHNSVISTDGVSVLCGGPLVPGLPLIAPRAADDDTVDCYRAALAAAMQDNSMARINRKLLLKDATVMEEGAYAQIDTMEKQALAAGYSRLS